MSLAFVCGIHWQPMNSPHKWSVTRKMFPFDDVIMLIFVLLKSLLLAVSRYVGPRYVMDVITYPSIQRSYGWLRSITCVIHSTNIWAAWIIRVTCLCQRQQYSWIAPYRPKRLVQSQYICTVLYRNQCNVQGSCFSVRMWTTYDVEINFENNVWRQNPW